MRAEPSSRLAIALLTAAVALTSMAVAPLAAQDAPAQEEGQPKAKGAAKPKAKRERPAPPPHEHGDKTYMGREIAAVMSYLGAEWLYRASRMEEEEPERMLDALEIEPGMTVADVGAGVGYHSLRLANRVGPKGRVYATDVQPQMISMLRQNAAEAKAKNVTPVLCTASDPKLPAGKVDLILMVDVYHECSDPENTLKGLHKALKPGGRLVLVEFRAEDPGVPIKPEHKMTVEQVRKEIEPQGFAFQKLHDFLPWQHIIVFQKPDAVPKPEEAPKPANP